MNRREIYLPPFVGTTGGRLHIVPAYRGDKPARVEEDQFQHPELVATGWFRSLNGPFQHHPVQFYGVLTTGEYVFFKARETTIKLDVYPSFQRSDNKDRLVRYEQRVETDPGDMSDEQCLVYIKRWIAQYLASKQS